MLASVISDPTAIIVVILPEVLVARDIEMIVRERRPKAHVLVARSLGEAMESMPSGRIEVAFIQLDPRIVANSPLGHRISAEGGRVVLLSEDLRQGLPDGWTSLPYPFASEDVAALLTDGTGEKDPRP